MYICTYTYTYIHTYTHIHMYIHTYIYFPGDTVVKNLSANAGGAGNSSSIPGSGRSPGVGNGNSVQCMDRGAW